MAHDSTAPHDTPDLPPRFRRRLLRQLVTELAPLLIFFLVFLAKGLLWACAAYGGATIIAFAAAWQAHRRIPVLPSLTAFLVLLFAGLTIALDDATFIKIKPTVVNGFYGILLGIGWLLGYPLVARVLGPDARLDRTGLRIVTIAASIYLLALAGVNELVWRTLPTEQWVLFKVFVLVGCNLLFACAMLPVVRRHLQAGGAQDRPAATGRFAPRHPEAVTLGVPNDTTQAEAREHP
ncbi:MAG: septation protein IspZ [Sneathiellaceae bacterium]